MEIALKEKRKWELSKNLAHYKNSDFATQQKVSFVYYLNISLIGLMIFLLISTCYLQQEWPASSDLYYQVIIIELFIFAAFFITLFLLIKGFYNFSAYSILLIGSAGVWIIMFIDQSPVLQKMDTVVYIVAGISMAAIMVSQHKLQIILYTLANISLLIVFSSHAKIKLHLQDIEVKDFLFDTLTAFMISGILSFNIHRIFNRSLIQAMSDIDERSIAEEKLRISEEGYRAMFEQNTQPMLIYDPETLKMIEVNNAAINLYKFSREEFLSLNMDDIHVLEERERFHNIILKNLPNSSTKIEIRHLTKSGKIIWVEAIGMNINYKNKRARHIMINDITDKKNAEIALSESEQKFREMADLMPQIIYETDLNGNITYVNKNAFNVYQYSEEDVRKGINIISTLTPENQEIAIENFTRITNGEDIDGFQYNSVRKDGSIFPIQVYAKLIMKNDKPFGLRGIVIDITERLQSEENIRQSAIKYFNALESLPMGCAIIQLNGKALYINQTFANMFGYTLNEIPDSETWFNLSFPDIEYQKKVRERWNFELNQLINNTYVRIGDIFNVTAKNGELKSIEFHFSIFDNEILILFKDVTARVKAEEALKQSEELFKVLIESVPNALTVNDLNGRFLIVNKTFCTDTGFSSDEIIGKTASEIGIYKDLSKQDKIAKKVLSSGSIQNLEVTFKNNCGDEYDTLYSGKLINHRERKVILSSVINISEKKKIERELEKYRNHLEILVDERTTELELTNKELSHNLERLDLQQKKLKSTFNNLRLAQKQLIQSEKMASLGILAAGVAHEINNPLNYISIGIVSLENYFVDNLKDHIGKVSHIMQGIQTGVTRAATIVSSLNNYSRQDDLSISECDIHAIIDDCLVMLNIEIKNRIEIEKRYSLIIFRFNGNEGKLHQAMLNIIGNAVQAIENKGKITIITHLLDKKLKIMVEDTGKGIEAENINKIFDPFFTTKAPGKGTGLGLAITYKIIQEHKGTIEFESESGNGTRVIIYLPLDLKITPS